MWQGRGRELLGPIAYIDVDGTLAPTYGKRKQGMDISYKGIWGYAPLVVSLANTKEVLYVVNRPGNVPSHTDAAQWIDRAMDHVDPHAERICLRGDTDFSLTAHFDRWAVRADFIFGMDASAALRSRAEALDEACWQRLERAPRYETLTGQKRQRFQADEKERIVRERGYVNLELNYEDVAEFSYQPGKCGQPYRVVALRKNISKMKGEHVLFDEIRLLLLHHDPHGSQRRGSGPVRQRALRPGEHHRAAQERRQRAAGPPIRSGQQLGLHGHRRPGLEYQVVVRPDDAPKERPQRVHPHGVPALHPQHHPDPMPRHAPGSHHHPPADRLPAHTGPLLQRLAHHRAYRLRVVHGHSEGRCSLHAHRAATAWPRTPTL